MCLIETEFPWDRTQFRNLKGSINIWTKNSHSFPQLVYMPFRIKSTYVALGLDREAFISLQCNVPLVVLDVSDLKAIKVTDQQHTKAHTSTHACQSLITHRA